MVKFLINLTYPSQQYSIIKRNGVSKIPNKKYKVNEDYFKLIDNQDKAYWLGFLYADGYVRIHQGRSVN